MVLRIVIVGGSAAGKTTFLGLLYTAQVRSGSDKADTFRFHTPYESLEGITDVFQQLMAGGFPDLSAKEGIRGVNFELAYRRHGQGIISRLRDKEWVPDAFATFRITLLRNLEEEISQLLKGSVISDESMNDVLDGDAVSILVDSTKLAPKGEDSPESPLEEYDRAVESLLAAMERLRGRDSRRLVHPLFILSKFDAVKPEVLRAANLGPAPPRVREKGRAAYAEALLKSNLPRTIAKIGAGDKGALRFAKPAYFFSWVRTEKGPSGSDRVRLRRTKAAGWEPDYSSQEYMGLLAHLRDLASEVEA